MKRLTVERRLHCAAALLDAAGEQRLVRERRRDHVPLLIGEDRVVLRDQAPLYDRNVEYEQGWRFADLDEFLNQFVYFWPGTSSGPSDYGQRHFARYADEQPVIVRVPTAALFEVANVAPSFSAFNTGSPRCSGGRRSPRGPGTFSEADAFPRSWSRVVEVAFRGSASLPPNTEWGQEPQGPWQVLLRQPARAADALAS